MLPLARYENHCKTRILRHHSYRGIIVHNRVKKVYRRGTKVRVARPESEWLRIDVPELRIVDEGLWSAVEFRIEKNKRMTGNAARPGQPPKHLLSSIARCGLCGGAMQAVNGRAGTQIIKVYVCHTHRTQGNAVCPNTLARPVAKVDGAVADWIVANVLREELVIETVREVRRRLAERARRTALEVPQLQARAETLRRELQKLAEALVATDEKPHTVVRLIAEREKTLTDVEARLAAVQASPSAIDLETRRMEKEARRRLGDFRALLGRRPEEGRRALEALLDGPLVCQPIESAEGKRYQITGQVALGSLFTIDSDPNGN
jgi:hypothetical protein